ncbi:PAP1-domain-containing protein [Zalerion maritima]|uniref:PAP1-domain-containing protein n=1 Tax=Zalerion maritima TaxID=339359 RepID=A0AAD5RGK0_9PEZI|nr:PAP1-domain-containing protein [Zalerion maritima]
MTSNPLPNTNGFILTPQQQNLLFAALNSNNPNNTSPHNSALSMSPTSINQSPHPNNDVSAPQDNSFLDYDLSFNPDSSYDFDLGGIDGDMSQGQMIGDLPGTSSSDTPASPDQTEKRSRPEDDDEEEEESSPKRRESTEKIPKKPGRKPLTSEPSSKRKAQNRAAQRAFRERKEKHVKDLETKVEELQKYSESANNENDKLRAQIDRMTSELNQYKKRISLLTTTRSPSNRAGFQWGNAAVSNLNDVNFQFEFPKFGALPGPVPGSAQQITNGSRRSTSVTSKDSQTSPKTVSIANPTSTTDALGRSASHSNDEFSSLNGLFGTAFTNNSMGAGNHHTSYSTDSIGFNPGATNTSSPSASSGSNVGASSSCGTSPEPFNQSPMGSKPLDTLTTIGEETTPAMTTSNNNSSSSNQLGGLDLGSFDWLSNQNQTSFDPQIFGNYREPQENVLSNGFDDPSFFNDAFDLDFLTPFNVPESAVQPRKDILAEIDAQKMDDVTIESTPSVTKPPANFSGQLLTCRKIWEKLQACPKVQSADVDLDGLCKDLKDKAKCTGNGPMLNEKDFKDVITKYVKPECANTALNMAQKPEKA